MLRLGSINLPGRDRGRVRLLPSPLGYHFYPFIEG